MQPILRPGMRAPTRPARDSSRLLVLGAILLSLGGCKAAPGTRAESPATELDDIVAIESELAVNAERLQAQGVRLASATAAAADKSDGGAAQISGDLDDESPAPTPSSPPPPAEPEPERAPTMEAGEDAAGLDSVRLSRSERTSQRRRRRRGKKTRCERICDLAEATCTLADRICGLADEHVDDVRYEEACGRATLQCEAASEACSACED